MTVRRWRVKSFNGRTWYDYRYYDEDLPAFKDLLLRRKRFKDEFHSLNVKLDSYRTYMNPGGTNNLLWIYGGKGSHPLGESREYWENVLQQAKNYVKSIYSDTKRREDNE